LFAAPRAGDYSFLFIRPSVWALGVVTLTVLLGGKPSSVPVGDQALEKVCVDGSKGASG
jgi:hypothetical protein